MASIEERRRALFGHPANQNQPSGFAIFWGVTYSLLNFAGWFGGLLYLVTAMFS